MPDEYHEDAVLEDDAVIWADRAVVFACVLVIAAVAFGWLR
jgi:hypothetical protein